MDNISREEWRKRFFEDTLKNLSDEFGMTRDELISYSVETINNMVGQVMEGKAIACCTMEGKGVKIYNLPVLKTPNVNRRISDLVGIVNQQSHPKHSRIVKITTGGNTSGIYRVQFADKTTDNFQDDGEKLEVYYRKPFILNEHNNPTYKKFRMRFTELRGDEDLMRKDYSELFSEPLPEIKR